MLPYAVRRKSFILFLSLLFEVVLSSLGSCLLYSFHSSSYILIFSPTMMGLSFTRLAVLTAVLCPLVAPLHVPSTAPLTPRVPWKEHGIWDGPAKRPDGGCKNRPRSRDCWNGEFNIDTDMDLKWPNTGKVVKVGRFGDIRGRF